VTVRPMEDGTIMLEGNCPIEDADGLLQCLLAAPAGPVDISLCKAMHTAVIQVLFAARPVIRGPSPSPFFHKWIEPRF
jgi:hypothetical protein